MRSSVIASATRRSALSPFALSGTMKIGMIARSVAPRTSDVDGTNDICPDGGPRAGKSLDASRSRLVALLGNWPERNIANAITTTAKRATRATRANPRWTIFDGDRPAMIDGADGTVAGSSLPIWRGAATSFADVRLLFLPASTSARGGGKGARLSG